jgi:predicted metal-binding membrane protein
MSDTAVIVRLLRRDRALAVSALIVAIALAWAYLLLAAEPDASMTAMAEGMTSMPWTLAAFAVTAVMWIAMMVAMMLPSAAPMILLFAAIGRKRPEGGPPIRATGLFVFGYLVVWAAFSIAATAAQWGLQQAALLSPAMATGSATAAGALLLLAGVYQLTPLKQACLRQCRSPLEFLTRFWQAGSAGAVGMGVRHGLLCLGCCWAMMALLFVGGVMNLLWVAALTLFVLLEKILPGGRFVGQAGGIGLVLWGGAILLASVA